MFGLGMPELILILVVALVVFGPNKMPEVGAAIGKVIRDFRRASQGITDEIQSVTRFEAEDEMRTRLMSGESSGGSSAAATPETSSAPEDTDG